MLNQALLYKQDNLKPYSVGEKEYRPWGYFSVIDVDIIANEEFCDKEIVMMPHKAMSVQRHALRREHWTVVEGTLTVILDGELHILQVGESIAVPLGTVHCMINSSDEKVVIHERQTGVCREDDNDRFCDVNGRDIIAPNPSDLNALESVELYKRVINNL